MFQKDYILRMIEQLTIAVVTLLRSKSKNDREECHQMLNGALYDLTGMSEETLLKLYHNDLIEIMSGGKVISTEKCFALAEMLKLKGDASEDDSARSFAFYLKSLNIFVEVILSECSKSENRYPIINDLIRTLKPYKLPKDSTLLLFKYYEFTGQYDKAEDVLFNLVTTFNKDEIIEAGFAFYERLKGKTTMELEAGNLPLDEVQEGLKEYLDLVKR